MTKQILLSLLAVILTLLFLTVTQSEGEPIKQALELPPNNLERFRAFSEIPGVGEHK